MKEGWEVKKLGEVCETITKGTTPKTIGFNYTDFGINFIKVESISESGCFLVDNFAHVSDDCHNALLRSQLKERDLLFSIAGALGRTAIVNKSILPANTNQALAIIRLKDKSDLFLRFLQCYFRSMKVKNYIDSIKVGVAQMNLSLGQLKDFPIIIPPLSEQSRIVEELDLLSNIIEKKRQQLSELDNLAQSIFYDMFGDPVTNEKSWEVKKLGEVCKTSSGGTPSKSHSEYYEGGIIPWLRSGEVNQMYISKTELFITEEGLANSSAKWFPENTVVIAMYGATVGQVGILCKMMTTNQAICGIFPNESFIPIYLYHFLLSKKEEYIKLASGGAQPNISQNIIRDTLVCCPKKELQQLFAKKIEAIEKQKALIKQSIAETEELFNSRMDYYFS